MQYEDQGRKRATRRTRKIRMRMKTRAKMRGRGGGGGGCDGEEVEEEDGARQGTTRRGWGMRMRFGEEEFEEKKEEVRGRPSEGIRGRTGRRSWKW